MVEISKEIVKRIFDNARVKVEKEKLKDLERDLKEVLDYFEKLKKVKTKEVEPSFHPIKIESSLREDRIKESVKKKELLRNKINVEGDFFIGPSVK